ncbi:class I SAM-dependent methyltransferase [Azospirillum himalayense]|uniref:Class I SAM-dependent methyltransferase n=1 Tax=Azospirillum himalayense TaxID=654847 RepID=A0ABW0G167_9PROT
MSHWSEGYNADIAYTNSFYRDLAPGYLAYVCQLAGFRAPDTDAPFRYCELGCGQGLTLTVMAATHARSEFVGIDFNPAHIAAARRLAAEAGIGNVTFREDSFQELARRDDRAEEPFDIVVLHGVYSWISAENRRAIVDFLGRALKPGGLVYVSYNTQSGWAPLLPLQSLMLDYATAHPGRSDRQMDGMLAFLNRLKEAGAAYFQANPMAGQHLATMAQQDRRYLAHEYINTHWEPLNHARVARDMSRAKLGFVGSATIPFNNDELALPATLRTLLAEITDPLLAHGVRELAMNQPFRRDIFVRGPEPLDARSQWNHLNRQRFTLTVPRDEASLALPVPLGELRHDPAMGEPILDALSAGTPSFAELAAIPALNGQAPAALSQFVSLLVSAHQAHPVGAQGDASRETARALNQALARRMLTEEEQRIQIAPAIGTAILADTMDRLAHTGLLSGVPANIGMLADAAVGLLQAHGRQVFAEDGTTLTTPQAMHDRLIGILSASLPRRLPVWQRLGVI